MTFDGWDTQYYGDCLSYGQDSLMHFRTKGSKNGVRRYQMPDGTWTPLGLKERKAREGWGERRAARKEARAQRREERRAARAAVRSANLERAAQYKAAKAEEKRLRNPKRMTDAELNRGIERLKKEEEFRELSTPAIIKTGQKLVNAYFAAQERKAQQEEAKLDREERRYKLVTANKVAQMNLIKAKTESKRTSRKARLTEAKAKLDEAKTKLQESKVKNTISGAIRRNVSSILRKHGDRLVNDMSDHTVANRAASAVKTGASKATSGAKKVVSALNSKRKSWIYSKSGSSVRPTSGKSLNY